MQPAPGLVSEEIEHRLRMLTPEHAAYVLHRIDWLGTARPEQVPPADEEQAVWLEHVNMGFTPDSPKAATPDPAVVWTEFGVQAGRGAGKTRTGAEWLFQDAWEDPQALPRCVVAPTQQDVRMTCFEGESGLLNIIPHACIANYNRTELVLTLKNGAMLRGFSAEKADRLRGPQHAAAWCFSGETPVLMADGSERPIAEVCVGDMVQTRYGPRRVLRAGRSNNPEPRYRVTYGLMSLTGTGDHPILTNRGWVPLGDLREGDLVWSVSGMTRLRGGSGLTGIFATDDAESICTGAFTKIISDFCRKASTYITRMGTQLTTTLTTSKLSRTENTEVAVKPANVSTNSNVPRFLPARGRGATKHLLNELCVLVAGNISRGAERVRRVSSAAASVLNAGDSNASHLSTASALTAARGTWLPTGDSGFAAGPVTRRINALQSTAPRSHARTAGAFSSRSEITPGSAGGPALSRVPIDRVDALPTRDPVYNLTVEGEHEFIAGGVVVHNCDELAAWGPDGEDVYDMLMFGMRLGPLPRIMWTSTPKPNPLIRRLTAPKAGRIIVRGSTFDNRSNLPDSFFAQLEAYDGTKLGRQELYGELLDPEESGIIRRSWLRLWPADKPLPSFQWIIMSLDTAFTERTLDKKGDADPTACGVFGVFVHEKRTNVMLLDCWEAHLGLPDLARRVRREMNNRYGDDEDDAVIKPAFGSPKPVGSGRKPDILLIEDKGSGISLRQTLAESGLEAYAYNPGRADKLARLHIVSPIFAQKRVWMPESNKMPGKPRNWCEPLIAQLCSFTGEGSIKHDDYVDVTTQAIRLCMDKQLLTTIRPPEERKGYEPPPPPDYTNPYAA